MNLFQAAEKGIRRLQKHGEVRYIRIDIINKTPGPWLRFFTPNCQIPEEEFRSPRFSLLSVLDLWEEYTGPRSQFDKDEEPNHAALRE